MLNIKVPASLDTLNYVNECIAESLPMQFKSLLPQIELVLEELLVNICKHAYKGENAKGDAEIVLQDVPYEGQPAIYISVRDWGPAFDPFTEAAIPDTSLDAQHRPVGGLGIHLIKSMVAHYNYEYQNNTNFIELYFLPKLKSC